MDKRAKIYLNMILAEDEPLEIVKRSLDSVASFVDGKYIAVTYKEKEPTDSELVKLLKTYDVDILFFKWVYDFSVARQFVMDNTPKGNDSYIYWQDADDVLVGGDQLKTITDDAFNSMWAAVFFDYWYMVDLDKEGNVREILVKHKRERIIRNDDTFKWEGALHETLIEQKLENVLKYGREECHIVHLTNGARMNKNIDRNIQILEETLRLEDHKDPRTVIYLAKAYYDKARMAEDPAERKIKFDLAVMLFHEFLEGTGKPGTTSYRTGSGWPEERAQAWDYVGQIAMLTGNKQIAIQAMQSAIDEAPYYPIYYVNLAMFYAMAEDYKKAKHWLTVATSIQEPVTTIITTPRDLKTKALEVDYAISLHENKLEQAIQDAKMLIEILPEEPELRERLVFVESLYAANRASQSIVFLSKYLENIKEADKIPDLLKAVPTDLQQEKFISEMKHLFIPATTHADNEISILCGPGFEEWSPKSITKGIGGSEEAVIYLSEELAKRGWKVTVYANPGKEVGTHNGVEYKMYYDINLKDEFNVLVLWRSIGFVDFKPKAKFILTWMHDVPNNPEFTVERVNAINKIAVLSDYHKSLLRLHKSGLFVPMPATKIFQTANGLPDLSETKFGERNPHRIIYASSANRGLIYLLNNWKKIKDEVPDAELHVYYGFEIFDVIHKNNPTEMKWKENVLQLMKQEGIIYRGRVGHKELHEEFTKAGVWAYPTDFTEISCITAMKAQALGAVPVTTNFGALQETVKNGIKVDVDITDEEGQLEYIDALIELLKDEKKQEELREPMMKWAKDYFSWKNISGEWDALFKRYLQNPELAYQEKYVK